MKKLLLISSLFFFCSTGVLASSGWHQKADFGGVARHRGAGISIGNKGYIGLGHYNGSGTNIVLQDWWEFDPSANTWTQMANYPVPNYAVSSFSVDNKGIVGAGIFGLQFYSYDPLTNAWSAIASPAGASSDQLGFSVNGKGYHVVGTALYEYNPSLGTWTTKSPMPFSCISWSSAFTIGDKAYIKSNNQLWEYKQSIDDWALKALFPGPVTGGAAAFAINGNGYIVCGGYIGWLSELVTEVWEFNPVFNEWTQLEDFPGMARRFTTGFAIGDKGYMGIGTNGTNFRDFWEFDELLATPKNSPALSVSEPYPNPSSSLIHFDAQTQSGPELSVVITDASGRIVHTGDFANGVLDVSKQIFGSGTFFYRISSADKLVKSGQFIFE